MTADTTTPSYWLNWRFLLCAVWILLAMFSSSLVLWEYEGKNKSRNGDQQEAAGRLYKGESWATCSKSINPVWLLVYRVIAFCCLIALVLADAIIHGVRIFYFYTLWTITLVTIYFAIGSSLSIHGCLLNYCKVDSESQRGRSADSTDVERGSNGAPPLVENANGYGRDDPNRETASAWEFALQIIFQTCAGAVVLTDSMFWLVIYPFLTDKDYKLSFLLVSMHSVNAVFLTGEAILNSLRFPIFRIAYFLLWTCTFVVFQWIVHACVSMSWPYPFLDLSSQYAPIWYLSVGLLHFPSYGMFALILKIKKRCLLSN